MNAQLFFRLGIIPLALSALLLAGCGGPSSCATGTSTPAVTAPAAATPAPQPAAMAPAAEPVAGLIALTPPVRIKAGPDGAFTDSTGNVWLTDQGFDGGEVVDRPDLVIANTPDPALYRSEHYSMGIFSCKLPNGKYVVKLHFAEIFEGITGPGQRVFSFNVQGHEHKDLDLFVAAGGPLRAYVVTENVEVTDGVFKITFTPNVENPQICGLEILPAP